MHAVVSDIVVVLTTVNGTAVSLSINGKMVVVELLCNTIYI